MERPLSAQRAKNTSKWALGEMEHILFDRIYQGKGFNYLWSINEIHFTFLNLV